MSKNKQKNERKQLEISRNCGSIGLNDVLEMKSILKLKNVDQVQKLRNWNKQQVVRKRSDQNKIKKSNNMEMFNVMFDDSIIQW